MAKSKRMSDEDLVNAVEQQSANAIGATSSTLSNQRSKAMDFYFGKPFGGERADHSQVVTREVLDTIEWLKPELMKIFS